MRIQDLLIIDLEASGLGVYSWPIEVGVAWVEAGKVRAWSRLIRPEPHWNPDAWDPMAEKVHGIPRQALTGAGSARSVAEELTGLIAGRPVFSDAPEFDMRWARLLLDALPSDPGLRVLHYDEAVGRICGDQGANWAYERLERRRTPHRAGPDAARMLSAILYGLERGDGADPDTDGISL